MHLMPMSEPNTGHQNGIAATGLVMSWTWRRLQTTMGFCCCKRDKGLWFCLLCCVCVFLPAPVSDLPPQWQWASQWAGLILILTLPSWPCPYAASSAITKRNIAGERYTTMPSLFHPSVPPQPHVKTRKKILKIFITLQYSCSFPISLCGLANKGRKPWEI